VIAITIAEKATKNQPHQEAIRLEANIMAMMISSRRTEQANMTGKVIVTMIIITSGMEQVRDELQ
jgi:hypothetical protein